MLDMAFGGKSRKNQERMEVNRNLWIGIVLGVIQLCFVKSIRAQDSLTLHFVGYFKNERFQILHDSLIYEVEMNQSKLVPVSGFAVKILLPNDVKDGELLNLVVKRKGRVNLRFKDTRCYVQYMSNMPYCVFIRTQRVRNKYSFYHFWTCRPADINIVDEFWTDSKGWEVKNPRINPNGLIDAYKEATSWW